MVEDGKQEYHEKVTHTPLMFNAIVTINVEYLAIMVMVPTLIYFTDTVEHMHMFTNTIQK